MLCIKQRYNLLRSLDLGVSKKLGGHKEEKVKSV